MASRLSLPRSFLLLTAALAAGCHHGPTSNGTDADARVDGDVLILPAVSDTGLATVTASADAQSHLLLPGRLVWDEDHTVRVYTPLAGRVLEVPVQAGDRVAAGATLAVLSASDYGAAQADVHKAEAAQSQTAKALNRARDLAAHGIVAARDLEQAEADAAAANAELQRAAARLKAYGRVDGDVDQHYRLTSPVAGVVVERHLSAGQELGTDTGGPTPFVVTDPTQLWVQLDAHDGDVAPLQPGAHFTLRAGAYGDEHFDGVVTQVADALDTVTRTLRVRGRIANPDRRLKAEMYVTADFTLNGTAGVAVPASAVVLSGTQHYVFVADGPHRYRRISVEVADGHDGLVPLRSGVTPGMAVVVQGALYLQQLMRQQTEASAKPAAQP